VFFRRGRLADIVAAPEHCGAYIKHHARTRVLHPCCDPPTGWDFVESVIARLFSDFQDRTMTRRPLDLNEGAFRRFGTCSELSTWADSSEVCVGNVVAALAPVRPGFTPVDGSLKSQRSHAMQARSKPQ
jgi:hypothetical protein